MPHPPLPGGNARGKTSPAKKTGKTRAGKRKRVDDDGAYNDRHDLTAQSLVQQVK